MEVEKGFVFPQIFADEKLETPLGTLELIAFMLELFHARDDLGRERGILRERRIKLAELLDDERTSRDLASYNFV